MAQAASRLARRCDPSGHRPPCPAESEDWGRGRVPFSCLVCRLARLAPADRPHVVRTAEALASRPPPPPIFES